MSTITLTVRVAARFVNRLFDRDESDAPLLTRPVRRTAPVCRKMGSDKEAHHAATMQDLYTPEANGH